MPETLLDDLGVDPLFESQRRPRVPQTVEGQAREVVRVRPTEKHVADGVGAQARTIGPVEHQAGVGEVRTDEQALFEHATSVVPKGGDGSLVERYRPAPVCRLGLTDAHHAAGLDDRLNDAEAPGIEVDVGPPQPEHLTTTHAGRSEQHPQRMQPIAGLI